MPVLPIPLFTRAYKNADGIVLNDDAAVQYNGFIDQLGGLNIRPGETLAINSAKSCDGLYHWPDKDFIVCVDEGYVTLRSVLEDRLINVYSGGNLTFGAGKIVIFANDSNYVFMAGGGAINYISASGTLATISDVDAPTAVTHVAFLDGYILANNGNGKFYWCDISTPTAWSALSFASAEANPDVIQGLYVVQRQIYLLGTVSTEIWENDGDTPFSRIPGGLIEIGCIAKYSAIKRGNSLVWLSDTRQFVEFTGTAVKFLSSRYDKEISNFASVSDCIGFQIYKDGQEYCLFQFPTEGRTLAYSPAMQDWSEWGNWNPSGMEWEAYDIRASARDILTGQTFVGKGNAEVIACLSSNSRVDLLDATTTRAFKFLRQTGHIDHGMAQQKILERLSFRAKRGSPNQGENPVLMFRYRNDGNSSWSNIREIDLGAIGITDHHINLYRLGCYRSRQFEISVTDDIQVTLSNAEADITVLR